MTGPGRPQRAEDGYWLLPRGYQGRPMYNRSLWLLLRDWWAVGRRP